MKKQIVFLLFFFSISQGINGQIFCPDDITVSCLSDLSTDECGLATVVSGNYHPSMVKYIDDDQTNACNEGHVYRRFYLDVDYSNTYTENEPSCIQTITTDYDNLPLNIQYPSDKEYTCLDEVPVESPTWLYNPCDLVGYTYEDEIFEFEEGACLKIIRTFSVINWCVYDVDANDGLYTGIQVIKIVDNNAPEIGDCQDEYFDTDGNCEAMVTLTNSAMDVGDCPSGSLTWRVSVDLWGDGTEDLFYGPNENAPFKLDPVGNGDEVSVEIPEALGMSKHKVVWKVTDGCGNVRSCSNEFFVEDNKPPTPYCLSFTSAALDGTDGGQIVIPATFFNVDKVDNCSEKEKITLSYSENIDDTEKVIACGDTGFQFFRIYHTDEAGNQDFCEVFMLIFDNGTCFGKFAPNGIVSRPNGTSIDGASAYLMDGDDIVALVESDAAGYFSFGMQDLMEHYTAEMKKEDLEMSEVDLADFILMRSALLGLKELNIYQKIAADINQDKSFDIDDLYAFRDVLLGRSEILEEDAWSFVPKMYNLSSNHSNLDISNSIPYTSYEEGFNYFGVMTGDITGADFELEDDPETEGSIELTLKLTHDQVEILANDIMETDAFQFKTNDGEVYTNLEGGRSYLENDLLLTLNIESNEVKKVNELITSSQIYKKGSLNPSTVNWVVIDERDDKNSIITAEPHVYPIPMQEILTVEAPGIGNLAMYNLAGERVEIESTMQSNSAQIKVDQQLPIGIYVLRFTSNGKNKIVKVVR